MGTRLPVQGQVSWMCHRPDEQVEVSRARPRRGEYPYLGWPQWSRTCRKRSGCARQQSGSLMPRASPGSGRSEESTSPRPRPTRRGLSSCSLLKAPGLQGARRCIADARQGTGYGDRAGAGRPLAAHRALPHRHARPLRPLPSRDDCSPVRSVGGVSPANRVACAAPRRIAAAPPEFCKDLRVSVVHWSAPAISRAMPPS